MAKTALVAFVEGDARAALRAAAGSQPPADGADGCAARAEALVRRVYPHHAVEPTEDAVPLPYSTYPADDEVYAAALPGVEVVCDRRLALDRPSELPEHVRALAAGRRIVVHSMHSVVDWLAFAVWEADGTLVRSLSVSPDGGIQEDIGERFDFELPYWAGEHPVEDDPHEGPYPLPFHPLELGEVALRALFGFVIEGSPEPDDVDAEALHLHGFLVTDPTGAEQAERDAAYAEATAALGTPQVFAVGPDGALRETSLDDL